MSSKEEKVLIENKRERKRGPRKDMLSLHKGDIEVVMADEETEEVYKNIRILPLYVDDVKDKDPETFTVSEVDLKEASDWLDKQPKDPREPDDDCDWSQCKQS